MFRLFIIFLSLFALSGCKDKTDGEKVIYMAYCSNLNKPYNYYSCPKRSEIIFVKSTFLISKEQQMVLHKETLIDKVMADFETNDKCWVFNINNWACRSEKDSNGNYFGRYLRDGKYGFYTSQTDDDITIDKDGKTTYIPWQTQVSLPEYYIGRYF